MIARLKEVYRLAGGDWLVAFTTPEHAGRQLEKLMKEPVTVEIRKWEKGRTKDANAAMWAMCTDIGNALRPPLPKEEVYRRAIRDVGKYFPTPVKAGLEEEWQKVWSRNGVGWFAEITDRSKTPGYTLMFSYCGSSTYTTSEMSRLIDYLKDEMEQMGLDIPMSHEEEARLLQQWQRASCRATASATSAGG